MSGLWTVKLTYTISLFSTKVDIIPHHYERVGYNWEHSCDPRPTIPSHTNIIPAATTTTATDVFDREWGSNSNKPISQTNQFRQQNFPILWTIRIEWYFDCLIIAIAHGVRFIIIVIVVIIIIAVIVVVVVVVIVVVSAEVSYFEEDANKFRAA